LALLPLLAWASADAGSDGRPLTIPVAALLGVIQGATEFLPVSSSGHLSLAQRLFGIDAEAAGHRFNIAAHAGTLLAVLWVYRAEVVALLRAAAAPHRASPWRDWILAIVVATLPLGLALAPGFEAAIVAIESEPRLVGVALLATAAILWLAFRRPAPLPDPPIEDAPRLSVALGIGLAQLVAVIPGISRSGSTIAAGGLLGLDRVRAARFSFLISVPAIAGATIVEVRKALGVDAAALDPGPYAVGFVTSLIVGFFCLRWLLSIVREGNMRGFVIYLLIVGTIAVAVG
jgi:undecaprenyl-diphosphatase